MERRLAGGMVALFMVVALYGCASTGPGDASSGVGDPTAGCRIGDDARDAFLNWKRKLRPGAARVMTMRESRAKGVPPVVLYVADAKRSYLMVQLWGKLGPFGEYADYYAQFLTTDGGKSFRALNIPAEAATTWPTTKMPQDTPNIPHYCQWKALT